jgi:hypothetical protein
MVAEIINQRGWIHQDYAMHTFLNIFAWAFIYIWSFTLHHLQLMYRHCSVCWQMHEPHISWLCPKQHSTTAKKELHFIAAPLTGSGEDGLVFSQPSEQLLVSSHCDAGVTSTTIPSRKWALPLDTCQQSSQYFIIYPMYQNSRYISHNYEKMVIMYSRMQHPNFPITFWVY